jgi:hypothetical protein
MNHRDYNFEFQSTKLKMQRLKGSKVTIFSIAFASTTEREREREREHGLAML